MIGVFDLVKINTSSESVHLMLGRDGVFQDINGVKWYGSTLLSVPRLQSAINGVAPEGEIVLNFFQDPTQPDLVAEIKAQGDDYLRGRTIEFYVQRFSSLEEQIAPVIAPFLYLTRTMRQVTTRLGGAMDRTISVSFEGWTEDRASASRVTLDQRGHEQLIGR
ncbi:MAG: hypothetical protein AAF709_25780, partial [Pseudomonadota bacterium]